MATKLSGPISDYVKAVAWQLALIDGEANPAALHYCFGTDAVDTPLWEFRVVRVMEVLQAIENVVDEAMKEFVFHA